MDGRVLDEATSPVWLPSIQKLRAEGVTFAKTYAASPLCVPSRVSLATGRHTHRTKTWSNMKGMSYSPRTGELDSACVQHYSEEVCGAWKSEADGVNVTTTIVDAMIAKGYAPHIFGKLDIGAGILKQPWAENGNNDGFHGGASLITVSRTADVRRATRASPLAVTDDHYNSGYAWEVDGETAKNCSNFLRRRSASLQTDSAPFFLYCSFNAPHPPFLVNETWMKYVNSRIEKLPTWIDPSRMHPADSFMSEAKHMLDADNETNMSFNASQIRQVRRAYFGMVAQADFLVGSVLRALNASPG